jgi:hypothetical protein
VQFSSTIAERYAARSAPAGTASNVDRNSASIIVRLVWTPPAWVRKPIISPAAWAKPGEKNTGTWVEDAIKANSETLDGKLPPMKHYRQWHPASLPDKFEYETAAVS